MILGKPALLSSCAVLALSAAVPASAQQLVAAPTDATTIDEVIVTAQRRAERVEDVPLSLTVASAKTLEQAGVQDIVDLRLITPGLTIDRQSVHVQPVIRGVSAKDSSPGNEPAVAVYVDGVYQSVPIAVMMEFPDVERVEVAKGPQGTLFGRNATGGAISVFTRRPSYDLNGRLLASYGNLDDQRLEGFVNLPIVEDKVALSLSGAVHRRDGYFRNLVGGQDFGDLKSEMVRAKLLIEPTDRLRILLAAMYSDRDEEAGVANTILGGNVAGRLVPGTLIPDQPYEVAINPLSEFRTKNRLQSANVELDLGFATLTSITAYNYVSGFIAQDADFSSLSATRINRYLSDVEYKRFSQEVVLTSQTSGPLSWVVGAFYFDADSFFRPLSIQSNGATVARVFGQQYTEAKAVFGEASFEITDRLTAIAGVRFSEEKRRLGGHLNTAINNENIGHATFKSTTPRFSLRYELQPDANLYFTYSEGFKSGGFNASSLSPIAFLPETIKSYEVGIKTAVTQALRINVAGYYSDYQNLQEKAVVNVPGVGPVNLIANAASARIYGVEADAHWRVTPELGLTAAVSLMNAEYKHFPNATVLLPRLIGGVDCRCGNLETVVDASGNPLPRAPDFTLSLGANYTRMLAAGEVELSASAFYSSSYTFTPEARIVQPEYVTTNARASFRPDGSPVRISVWGRNLTDEEIIVSTTITPPSDAATYGLPRTYGVELEYTF